MNPLVIACTISFLFGVACTGLAVMLARLVRPQEPVTPELPAKPLDLDDPVQRQRFLGGQL